MTKKAASKSTEDARAQSMLRMNAFIEQMDVAERQSVGTWYNMPQEYAKGWVFIRAGLRTVPRAEAFAAQLRRMGYLDAPKGTRCVGFETDGDHGLYLCIPAQGAAVLAERKARARRAISNRAAFASQLRGVESSGFDVSVTHSEKEVTVKL